MVDSEDKRRWKNEADQLKKDLANRPKEIRRREVEIKLGKPAEKKIGPPSPLPDGATPLDDLHWRIKLGL